jgi:hypothetical protein
VIKDIVSKQRLKNVTTSNDLRTVLMKAKVDVSSNMLREKNINEMFNMIDVTFEALERDIIHIENSDLILTRITQNRFNSAVRDEVTAFTAFNINSVISQMTNTNRDNHSIHPQISNADANKEMCSQPSVINLQHTSATSNSHSLTEPSVTEQLAGSTAEVVTLKKRIRSESSALRKRRKELLNIINLNVLRAETNKRVIKESAMQKAARGVI